MESPQGPFWLFPLKAGLAKGVGGLALYLARSGEVEQAATVWAQALCWPYVANSQFYDDVVGQELTGITADLPADILAAARENGRSQDIWGMAEQLLAELSPHS